MKSRKYRLRAALALATSLSGRAIAGANALPDTPEGKLGAALIEHVNTDSPEQIKS